MASPASRSERAAQADAPTRLFLLFRIAADHYALDVHEVAEVLALRPLKQLPDTPPWVAGVLAHRGQSIPVIDLAQRAGHPAARQMTSTRLVLVHYRRPDADTAPALLGLILEQATDCLRCRSEDFRDYGLDTPDSPYLGPVLQHARGLVQRIHIGRLIPDDIHDRLFPAQRSPA